MKIILLKTVPGFGQAGDIKGVSDGYARNFLIPQGLANITTKHSLTMLEAQKRKKIKSEKLKVRSKKLIAKKISGKEFEIKAKADDKGTLYAKVDVKVIASELEKQGYIIGVDEIILDKAIKKAGEYEVELKIENEKVKIKLDIKI